MKDCLHDSADAPYRDYILFGWALSLERRGAWSEAADRFEELVDLGGGVVVRRADADHAAAVFEAQGVHHFQRVVIAIPHVDQLLAERALVEVAHRIARGEPVLEKLDDEKVLVWPDLVYTELICMVGLTAFLVVWAIALQAPLEQPASSTQAPNPSKAPWYFLGLQEMLVYFDPWMAGVVLPSLIIVGLMAIPYVDPNPKGNGYYTWSERKFAISTFLLGFLGLWIGTIVIGVFMRGPGWNLFMPWQHWDPHKVVPLTNVDLPYLLGIRSQVGGMLFGLACVGGWLVGVPLAVWRWKRGTPLLRELGPVRYGIVAALAMMMAGVLVKIVLRLALNVKYVLVIPNILNV